MTPFCYIFNAPQNRILMKEMIIHLLEEMDIDFSVESEGEIESIFFTAGLENGTVRGLIAANHEEQQMMIHMGHPTYIPETKRPLICELMARINYDDLFGGFVVDVNHGSLGYQCGFLFVENSEHSEKHLRRHFEASYSRLDYYLPVILEIAFGDKEPAQVLDELEHQVDPRLN